MDSKGEALTGRQFEEELDSGGLVGAAIALSGGRDAAENSGHSIHKVLANWFELSEEVSDIETCLEVLEVMKETPRNSLKLVDETVGI